MLFRCVNKGMASDMHSAGVSTSSVPCTESPCFQNSHYIGLPSRDVLKHIYSEMSQLRTNYTNPAELARFIDRT